jgi:hypothetical protein
MFTRGVKVARKIKSPLSHISGLAEIIKVLCPKCRVKAEKAADEWMAKEFEREKELYDGPKRKARFRLLKKRPR